MQIHWLLVEEDNDSFSQHRPQQPQHTSTLWDNCYREQPLHTSVQVAWGSTSTLWPLSHKVHILCLFVSPTKAQNIYWQRRMWEPRKQKLRKKKSTAGWIIRPSAGQVSPAICRHDTHQLESVFTCRPPREIKRVTYSGKSNSLAAATYRQRNMWLSRSVTKRIRPRGHYSYTQHKGKVRTDSVKEEAGHCPPPAMWSRTAAARRPQNFTTIWGLFLSTHPILQM